MTTRFDSFNRANESPLASPYAAIGGFTGRLDLTGNGVVGMSTDGPYYHSGSWVAGYQKSIVKHRAGAGQDIAPIVHSGSGGGGWIWFLNAGGGNIQTIGLGTGFGAIIATRAFTFSDGGSYALEWVDLGATKVLRCYVNGVQTGADVDVTASGNQAGSPALFAFSASDVIEEWTGIDSRNVSSFLAEYVSDQQIFEEALLW